MSFLAPLFLAGSGAAIGVFILHLIRRLPRGRLPFSSLMFLRASPPRLTRRSRLEHLLLLALRTAALVLLALAFARPFLREGAGLQLASSPLRWTAVLVDESASMRRGDLWRQATARAAEVLAAQGPADRAALYAFADRVRVLADFAAAGTELPVPPAFAAERLAASPPTWGGTDLGAALVAAAEALEALDPTGETGTAREVVLISDLTQGSRLEALAAHDWPAAVPVRLIRLSAPEGTNASLKLIAGPVAGDAAPAQPAGAGLPGERVRIANQAGAVREQFSFAWAGPGGAGEAASAYVPQGQSRTVRAPARGPASDRLVLTGDDQDFDNVWYAVPPDREPVLIQYLGADQATDSGGLLYYIERAFAGGGARPARVVSRAPGTPWRLDEKPVPRLVVVTEAVAAADLEQLRLYLEAGGTLLAIPRDAAAARSLATLFGPGALDAVEAEERDYAMLGEVDFGHPLFASFNEPRFSDFTRIRFWKHRRVAVGAGEPARVLARFDSGDPALIERVHKKGGAYLLTSGWHPADSQLALSSKFVPILNAMVEGRDGEARPQYLVNDPIPLSAEAPAGGFVVHKPDGAAVPIAEGTRVFTGADQPGIYRLESPGAATGGAAAPARRFAVNLSPEESRTAPLDPADLERRGVRLGSSAPEGEAERRRELRDAELESRQKLWRWLIAGAILVLIAETLCAGLGVHPGPAPIHPERSA
jgi:hypothetical protein